VAAAFPASQLRCERSAGAGLARLVLLLQARVPSELLQLLARSRICRGPGLAAPLRSVSRSFERGAACPKSAGRERSGAAAFCRSNSSLARLVCCLSRHLEFARAKCTRSERAESRPCRLVSTSTRRIEVGAHSKSLRPASSKFAGAKRRRSAAGARGRSPRFSYFSSLPAGKGTAPAYRSRTIKASTPPNVYVAAV
jgi:hypothetical protein